jgi:hypothetical protein
VSAEHSSPSDWERRRRLAEVFGETLPDTTSDEREPGERDVRRPGGSAGSSGSSESATDRWLREQVPPHHGQ